MSIISINEITGKELVLEVRRNGADAFFNQTVDQMTAVIRRAQRKRRYKIWGFPNFQDFEEEGGNDALKNMLRELRAIELGPDKEIDDLPGYLTQIYARCVFDLLRIHRKSTQNIAFSLDATISDDDDERYEDIALSLGAKLYVDPAKEQQAIELLSFVKQALVMTLFGMEYSHDEIAATLNISVVGSRTTLRRARQHLRAVGLIP